MGLSWIPPILPRDPPFLVFLGPSFFGVFGTFLFGVFPCLVLAFLRFPLVSILCDASEGHQSIVSLSSKKGQKRGVLGGVKKGQKRVKKGGKSKMTFSKCGRRGQKGPYPPTSHEKSAK